MGEVQDFFARYEEGANTFDPEMMKSLYMPEFMAVDSNGVSCGRNDEKLGASFVKRKGHLEQIGFKSAKALDVDPSRLDERYTMAKVHWPMNFEKTRGQPLEFRFFITYFLFESAAGLRAAFWISHQDEREVLREAGLIPAPTVLSVQGSLLLVIHRVADGR